MAKTPNGLGQYSGKVGGVVYAVQNGQQIVRSYQPVVSNPKSMAQRLQRAKAVVVGQVSKIVPYQILVALGNNNRERRSRFLRLAMNAATAIPSSSDPNVINAKLDAPNFVFAEGAATPTITINTATAAVRSVELNLLRYPGVSDTEFQASGALVVVTILSADGRYESVLYRFIDASEFGASETMNISLGHINEGSYSAAIYVAPFKTTDGKSLRARASELFGENADFAASMTYNPSALPLVWGRSYMNRVIEFTEGA